MIKDTKQKTLEYLNEDWLCHVDMIEAVKTNAVEILYCEDEGVLLYHIESQAHMCTAQNHETLKKMLSLMDGSDLVLLHQSEFAEEVMRALSLKHRMDCRQWVYSSDKKHNVKIPQEINIRLIRPEEVPLVNKYYGQVLSDEKYIRNRVEAGMLGAYVEGELAGFIGTHSEGSMGILEVLPEFRRRGIATCLEMSMVNHLLERARTPFCHVEVDNLASQKLQSGLGLTVVTENVVWMYNE